MTALRQLPRFLEQPGRMLGVRRGHERQRPAEHVDHFLVMAVVAYHAARPPRPLRRQLPLNEMRWKDLGRARRHHSAIHGRQGALRVSSISTLVPLPSSLVIAISPPHASISRRVTASPSPLPVVLVEKWGSKTRGITAAGIAAPLSTVSILILPSSSWSVISTWRAPARRAFSKMFSKTSRISSLRAIAQSGRSTPRSLHLIFLSPICSRAATSAVTAATSTGSAGGRSAGALPYRLNDRAISPSRSISARMRLTLSLRTAS